jgi:chemotaxis protein CheD
MSELSFNDLATREIFLNPGELGCGFKNEVFGTLLGSCVSITLWHPYYRFGSICHFVLPSVPDFRVADAKYGTSAFDQQKADLIRHGINIRECTAKIFGGGQMFPCSGVQDIGLRNVAMARQLVSEAGLPIAAENVGNEGYRRLYFDVETGEVWVKFDWQVSDQEDKVV